MIRIGAEGNGGVPESLGPGLEIDLEQVDGGREIPL